MNVDIEMLPLLYQSILHRWKQQCKSLVLRSAVLGHRQTLQLSQLTSLNQGEKKDSTPHGLCLVPKL